MNDTSKRLHRELDDATKLKISQALKGRCKTQDHANAISSGLKNYWKTIPPKSENKESEVEGF